MQSRMDKYNTSNLRVSSRTQKNQDLYEEVKNSTLSEFDINSNMSVIDDAADKIDVAKIRRMLDKKYSEEAPKRRSIDIPDFSEPEIEETSADTKEYDINAILAKAKKGKNVDYNKERLKKVRDTQFEILNNLDLELKKVEEARSSNKNIEAENNLMNLINTITELEIKNKTNSYKKEASQALSLLSDLQDDSDDVTEPMANIEEDTITEIKIKPIKQNINSTGSKIISLEETGTIDKIEDSHVEDTLSKLNINMSNYDDFADVSKRDTVSIIIKILIFVIIIALVIGAVYILDTLLELGLF